MKTKPMRLDDVSPLLISRDYRDVEVERLPSQGVSDRASDWHPDKGWLSAAAVECGFRWRRLARDLADGREER